MHLCQPLVADGQPSVPNQPDECALDHPAVTAERGCADDTIYRRCREAGLKLLLATPQFGATAPGEESLAQLQGGLQASVLAQLGPEEAAEWHAAVAHATQDGSLALAQPYRCAVSRRP